MGTRNLTMVINKEGEKKIAQYGQWDGYPSGVGVGVLNFLRNKDLVGKLIANLPKVRFIDAEGIDKEFIDSYVSNAPEWSSDPDNRTDEQKRWFRTYCHSDLAEEVLTNIANSDDDEILIQDSEDSAKKGGWVEYSYIIDLKNNNLVVHHHIDEPPVKQYSLDSLPSNDDFVEELQSIEEALYN